MSIPERTGRARPGVNCRWCGPRTETVLYEVKDSGTFGSEVVCCTCGKHQFRWGWEHQFWLRERHRELALALWMAAWLASQVLSSRVPAGPAMQLGLFELTTCTRKDKIT